MAKPITPLPEGTLLQGGKYKIIRFIKSGGFGCTYEAEMTILGARVAIKELFHKEICERLGDKNVSVKSPSFQEDFRKLERNFIHEASAQFRLQHNNIVRVTDVFQENGTAYYVMDYIEGSSLSEIVAKKGKLSETEALGYIRQVGEALKHVHSKRRMHMDIKPGNIMIDNSGRAILIDFGASKYFDQETGEETSSILGLYTNGYAPPEQINRAFNRFNPPTDVYALGATLYKLLTGKTPAHSLDIFVNEQALEPLPSSISPKTRNAVEGAMKLLCKQRTQTVDEFLSMLPTDEEIESWKEQHPEELNKENQNNATYDEPQTDSIKEIIIDEEGSSVVDQNSRNKDGQVDDSLKVSENQTDDYNNSNKVPKTFEEEGKSLSHHFAIDEELKNPEDKPVSEHNTSEINSPKTNSLENRENEPINSGEKSTVTVKENLEKTTDDKGNSEEVVSENPTDPKEKFGTDSSNVKEDPSKDDVKTSPEPKDEPITKPSPKPNKPLNFKIFIGAIVIGIVCLIGCFIFSKPNNETTFNDETNNVNVDTLVIKEKTDTIVVPSGPTRGVVNGHEWVDLGLTSGLMWATCNVGAKSQEEFGDYFAWGETTPKDKYTIKNSSTYNKGLDALQNHQIIDKDRYLTHAHDAAYVNWGDPWRMPKANEILDLINNTTGEWTSINGVKGFLVKSNINGETIFFPAAGKKEGDTRYFKGKRGAYWSSSPREHGQNEGAYSLPFDSTKFSANWDWNNRSKGLSIRPVISKSKLEELEKKK